MIRKVLVTALVLPYALWHWPRWAACDLISAVTSAIMQKSQERKK
jgi:hypothetical protein